MATRPLRAHVLLSAAYLATRAALAVAGLRFSFSLDWMWLSDPGDLRDNLLQTLFYFHAFPPGMNALTGGLLKISPTHAATLAYALFIALGLVFVNALFYLARAAGLSERAAFGLAISFSLTPPAIYFEHLYLYEWPVAALLCASGVLFYAAVREPSLTRWTALFAVCAVISVTRSTFHLVWLAAVVALALASTRRHRRLVLAGAAVPILLVVALFAKNRIMFGEFAASTFGPASYTLVTMARLPEDVRAEWMRAGAISPYAAISVYAPPREYSSFFTSPAHPEWPPQLTRLEHREVNAPNFNHWWLLEVHRARREDVRYTLRQRPFDYLRTAGAGLRDLFGPTTTWHPRDATGASPHVEHRQILGGYEVLFNTALHSAPISPLGIYVLLPAILLWTLHHAWRLWETDDPARRARGALLLFCSFQIIYVVAASSLLTSLESSRYRFQVEWAIWVVSASCAAVLTRRLVRRSRVDEDPHPYSSGNNAPRGAWGGSRRASAHP